VSPAKEKPLSPVPTVRMVLALVLPLLALSPPRAHPLVPPQLVLVRADEAVGSNEEPKRPRAHSREAL